MKVAEFEKFEENEQTNSHQDRHQPHPKSRRDSCRNSSIESVPSQFDKSFPFQKNALPDLEQPAPASKKFLKCAKITVSNPSVMNSDISLANRKRRLENLISNQQRENYSEILAKSIISSLSQNENCSICTENPPNCILYPCMHGGICL